MDFSFFVPTRIIGGKGCVRQNAKIFRAIGRRALIMTGARSAKLSGALGDVTEALEQNKVEYTVFDRVRENPVLSVVAEAGRLARETRADYIIAIGGGSVIDAARAASVFAARAIEPWEDIYKGAFSEHLPFVCVGTTAGTGSEVDDIAIITEDSSGQKRAIKKDILFADYAFCDYRYTATTSLRQTAATALDALTHCLESWFNSSATEPVVCAARRGIELIYPWLCAIAAGGGASFEPRDEEMRRDLFYGSLWGGIAIAHAGTGFPHPAGYMLTERMGVPHGVATALFEPAFLRHTAANIDYKDLKMLNAVVGSVDELCATIEALCRHDIALPRVVCADIARRAEQSANIARTLGGYGGDAVQRDAERLFLKKGAQEISGTWLFDCADD